MIALIDYGAGNLHSVQCALRRLGAEPRVTSAPQDVHDASAVILPGVGHFGAFSRFLCGPGWRETIIEVIESGKPMLGICLGLQVLFEGSEESPSASGLWVFAGRVERLRDVKRLPHIGWNQVRRLSASRMLAGIGEEAHFYFANSFGAPKCESAVALCDEGAGFVAVAERDNLFGTQFHPEKSGSAGLKVLSNFLEVAKEC